MINERLKYLRRNVLKKTQKQMAQVLGIKEPAYNMLELGKRPVREPYIKMLVYKYNVNEHWLKFGYGEVFQLSPKVAEIMEYFDGFNDLERRYFINLAEKIEDKKVLKK